jgi:hypothetical protein
MHQAGLECQPLTIVAGKLIESIVAIQLAGFMKLIRK